MALKHVLGSLLLLASGCFTTLRYEAPEGFALANRDWRSAHYKTSDNVGLKVLVFDNVEGGTLEYWSTDLVRKLTARHYTLRGQAPVKSGNGRPGTRFEFVLEEPGESPKFLVVHLLVTDDFIYVAQVAGEADLLPRVRALGPALVAGLEVRGCKTRDSVCRVNKAADRPAAAPTARSGASASDPTSAGSPGSARGEAPSRRSAPGA